jgi:predicted nucleic acid-binding protein
VARVTSSEEQKFLREIAEDHPILTPTRNNWLESGQILARIRDDKGFEPHKLRDLHFDVLIALTVRAHGARLITSNRADFELIREYRDFGLEVW